MSKSQSPLSKLEEIREALVAERRHYAEGIGLKAIKDSSGSIVRDMSFNNMIAVQGQIEAVDRMIADEDRLLP
jgi:hypothetical protein